MDHRDGLLDDRGLVRSIVNSVFIPDSNAANTFQARDGMFAMPGCWSSIGVEADGMDFWEDPSPPQRHKILTEKKHLS
jgi:hypothetical protein